jgi:hypothetical protein
MQETLKRLIRLLVANTASIDFFYRRDNIRCGGGVRWRVHVECQLRRPCTGQTTTAVVASLAGSSQLTNEMKSLFNYTDAFTGELNGFE